MRWVIFMIGTQCRNQYSHFVFILCFLLKINFAFAELSDCLDPDWELPKGRYLKQFCRDYESPELCPTVMDYDSDQDRLVISYTRQGYQYDMTAHNVCQYVEQGFDLKVLKRSGSESGGREIAELWLYADGGNISRGIPVESLTAQDEPDIIKLAARGDVTSTCNLMYYPYSDLIKGYCAKNRIKRRSYDGPFVMTYLRPLAGTLLENEAFYYEANRQWTAIKSEVSALKEKQKQELWLYSLRAPFGFLPEIDERSDETEEIEQSVVEYGFSANRLGVMQGFALRNIHGELQLQRCIGSFMKKCSPNLYPEMVRDYCQQNNMETVEIKKAIFCHDPEFSRENVFVDYCEIQKLAVDTVSDLLVVECSKASEAREGQDVKKAKGVWFMEKMVTCLADRAKFSTSSGTLGLLMCELGYAKGIEIPAEPDSTLSEPDSNLNPPSESDSDETPSSEPGSDLSLPAESDSDETPSSELGSDLSLPAESDSDETPSSEPGSDLSLPAESDSDESLSSESGSDLSLPAESDSDETLSSEPGSDLSLPAESDSDETRSSKPGSDLSLPAESDSDETPSSEPGSDLSLLAESDSDETPSSEPGSDLSLPAESDSDETPSSEPGSDLSLPAESDSDETPSSEPGSDLSLPSEPEALSELGDSPVVEPVQHDSTTEELEEDDSVHLSTDGSRNLNGETPVLTDSRHDEF